MFKPRYTRVRPAREEPVQVQLEGPGLLEVVRARDVSRSGLGLRAEGVLGGIAVEDEVDLVVTLPGRRPFRARGEIRHRSRYLGEDLLGVELVALPDTDRDRLEAYVASRLRAERGAVFARCPGVGRR